MNARGELRRTLPAGAYLGYEGIIKTAKENGVQAIHPGYGFLSENADFARRCEEEGITFIGPRSETITQMGDKVIAKALAKECNLPLVPGSEEATNDVEDAVKFAEEFGMPIMLKAAMGGGGRGMRIVRTMSELRDAFTRASSEAGTSPLAPFHPLTPPRSQNAPYVVRLKKIKNKQ